jgi:uncharacterized repeat protein (TIGR03803 family)
VTFDSFGNLYGTTGFSGMLGFGSGLIYKLSPSSVGWQESVVLEAATCRSGDPRGAVSFDLMGNLYTTASEGSNDSGSVLRFNPVTGKFHCWPIEPRASGAAGPYAGVLVDSERKALYGTILGAVVDDWGSVFQIDSAGTLSILYNFCSDGLSCPDGSFPRGSLVEDSQGDLYGTASEGGPSGNGVVFEITP